MRNKNQDKNDTINLALKKTRQGKAKRIQRNTKTGQDKTKTKTKMDKTGQDVHDTPSSSAILETFRKHLSQKIGQQQQQKPIKPGYVIQDETRRHKTTQKTREDTARQGNTTQHNTQHKITQDNTR